MSPALAKIHVLEQDTTCHLGTASTCLEKFDLMVGKYKIAASYLRVANVVWPWRECRLLHCIL
jgi:hypothetical protein